MSVLITETAMNQLEKLVDSDIKNEFPLKKLMNMLESLTISDIESNSSIRRVEGMSENIYMMRVGSDYRAFMTVREKDIFLLGVLKG